MWFWLQAYPGSGRPSHLGLWVVNLLGGFNFLLKFRVKFPHLEFPNGRQLMCLIPGKQWSPGLDLLRQDGKVVSTDCAWGPSITVCVLTCVPLFAISWTAARWASLSMEFSRQQHWSGLLFSTPGDLPDPGMKPMSLVSPAGRFFTSVPPRKPRLKDLRGSVNLGVKEVRLGRSKEKQRAEQGRAGFGGVKWWVWDQNCPQGSDTPAHGLGGPVAWYVNGFVQGFANHGHCQIWPDACFCMACELRMVFIFLDGWYRWQNKSVADLRKKWKILFEPTWGL